MTQISTAITVLIFFLNMLILSFVEPVKFLEDVLDNDFIWVFLMTLSAKYRPQKYTVPNSRYCGEEQSDVQGWCDRREEELC